MHDLIITLITRIQHMIKYYKYLFITYCFLYFSSISIAQQVRIQDPKNTLKLYSADIKEAVISIKPQGLFVEFGIYITYAVPNELGLSTKDTFEIQHFFQLPEKAIVNDSWLWVNKEIMQANVLDRWSAFNIYEGIVNRRRDPSVLYKNFGNNYEFRVFPLAAGKNFRKVKISVLIPSVWKDGKLAADLPLSILRGANRNADLRLIAYETQEWKNPFLSGSSTFRQEKDSLLGPIYSAQISSADLKSQQEISVVYSGEKSNGIYFSHSLDKNNTDQGFYQLAVRPKDLLPISVIKPRKVLILLDHDETNSLVSAQAILQNLRSYLLNNFDARDSFNIFFNKLNIKRISQDWIPADSINIANAIGQLSLGSVSLLRTGLYESYDFLRGHEGGTLLVFSADQTINNQIVAQKFKDELFAEYLTLPPTYVVDYSNFSTTVTWNQGTYYYGNELFYLILTSNTFGNHIHVQKYPENYSLNRATGEILNQMDNNQIGDKQIELHLKPKTGICFERFELFPDQLNNSKTLFQCGRFKGNLPFQLEVTVISKSNVEERSINLPMNTYNLNNEKFSQIHAGLKVMDLDSRSALSNIQINNIIEISKQNRVLSKYTAFLALEPGMQIPCTNCVDETKTGGNVADNDIVADSVKVIIFPNPFSDRVTIDISGHNINESKGDFEIYNAQGLLVKKFDDVNFSDDKVRLEWDGSLQPAGLYILRIKSADFEIKRKLHKIE